MIKIQVDISQIKNEIAQIHNELHATYNLTDMERRDIVNRMIERLRHLKEELSSNKADIFIK